MAGDATSPEPSGRLLALGTLPAVSAVVAAIGGVYMLLVAVGNVTDYATNFAFVQHVLAMDTTNFGAGPGVDLDPDVMWRAIDAGWVHTLAYLGIIAWEAATAGVLLVAAGAWVAGRGPHRRTTARRLTSIGLLMIVVLFWGGFIAVGGEWFQMWRSEEWNGLEPAFQNGALALLGLILVHLPADQSGAASTLGSGATAER